MAREKKRLHLNLSFLTPTDSKKLTSTHKSPRNFGEPNGVVGLGILAALNDDRHNHHDLILSNGTRGAVHAVSPRAPSNPIPILRNIKKNCCEREEKMEVCEEYTCVMSHVGENLIKKREYFEADNLGENNNNNGSVFTGNGGGDETEIATADFLSSCFLCQKMLHGLDVFMYRGDKAFCSAECRYRQISIDEQKEKKCHSGGRTPMEYSVSPCSVAAA